MPKNVIDEKDKQKELNEFLERKEQLKNARVNSGIETIWNQADADYLPHELGSAKKKILVENERTEVSSYISLSKDEWRSRIASNDPYIKIQTAISILFDRNPEAVFDPSSKLYESNTRLVEQLYHRTWSDVNLGSKKELRKFIFNLGKYGWSPARRCYKKVVRKDMDAIKRYDLENQKFEYEKKDIVDIDDVYFEAKNPFDVWIDDLARPDDPRSRRDWMWREVYDKITATNIFGKEIADGLNYSSYTEEQEESTKSNKGKQYTSNNLATIYFYENRLTDKYIIESGGKIIKTSPLFREDKELSLVDTYWTLKNTDCPYGIGINEIMRNNKVMYDRVRNMTIDQVVLSIYKMFFYSNSEQLDDEGGEEIRLEPGKGKKVIDPRNISWLDVPGPGRDAYVLQENLIKDMENDTGINRTLGGEITGKTAFEVSQAKEGALKRLSIPLRNIKSALEWDAKLCVGLQKMIYSVPKVYAIVDPQLITEYIANIEDDKDRYFVGEDGVFNVLKYREFQLSLENNNGNFEPSVKKQFFQVKPSYLNWDGQINIRVESMIEQSKALERQDTLQVGNILIPLIGQMAANPVLMQAYLPSVKEVLKEFDKNPKDWLPDAWLSEQPLNPATVSQEIPEMPSGETLQGQTVGQSEKPQTVVPSTQLPNTNSPAGLIQSVVGQNTR